MLARPPFLRITLAGLATLSVAAALPTVATAQGGYFGVADSASMDAMSGMGTGAATGQLGMQRAQAVAGGQQGDPFAAQADPFAPQQPAQQQFGGQPGMQFGGQPYDPAMMDPAMMDPAMMGMGMGAMGGGFGQQGFQQQVPQAPVIPQVTAIYGERVFCAVTGQMLDDAIEIPIYATFTDEYYDDGESGMDYRAGDNIWTNVTERNDALSPEAHLAKTRLIRGFQTLENIEPIRFFNVSVATTNPLSPLPNLYTLEEERDEKLTVWSQRFLRDFRENPDETGSWEFIPTHLPAPPFPPISSMPSNFFPPFLSQEQEQTIERQERQGQGGAQGAAAGRFGADEIMYSEGASSAYMGY